MNTILIFLTFKELILANIIIIRLQAYYKDVVGKQIRQCEYLVDSKEYI